MTFVALAIIYLEIQSIGHKPFQKDKWRWLMLSLLLCQCSGYRHLWDTPIAPTVTISNLRTANQPLQTGFIVGTASGSVQKIEVSLDGNAYEAAAGTENWKYALPQSALAWRMNSTHSIRVRTQGLPAGTTAESTIQVHKDHNRDINGDGYPEMAFSAQAFNSARGRTDVYFGGTNSLQSLQRMTITGVNANDNCGPSAIDDLDRDGYADLIVGCSMNLGTGRIAVFYGGSSVTGALTTANADATITGNAAEEFSYVTNAADFNNDGYLDLPVGALNYNSYDGKLYIFYGDGSRLTNASANTANSIITGIAADNGFGAYNTGDLNGDGYADLVATAYDYSGGTGRAYIFYGSSGYIPTVSSSSADRIITGEGISAYFGSHPALGDLNADGYDDLVLGAPRNNIATSKTYVFYGSASGISITAAGSANTIITGETNSALGHTTLADLDGDGYADMLLGAPKWNNDDTGKVFLIKGQSSLLPTVNAATLTDFKFGESTSLRFGQALAVWYRDGSGNPDFIVNAFGYSSFSGKIYIFANARGKAFAGVASSADLQIFADTAGENLGLWMTGYAP